MGDYFSHYLALLRNLLDDGEVFAQSMVETDKVGKLVKVRTDIGIYNLFRFHSVQYQ